MNKLRALAERIDALRVGMLFDEDDVEKELVNPIAEQHYCVALDFLAVAERHMKIAALMTKGEET